MTKKINHSVAYNTLVSIIIPVFNEEDFIGNCLKHLMAYGKEAEIIVVDGGSEDSTVAIAQEYPVRIFSSEKGRARQMNLGAQKATKDILYFLHADTYPPDTFIEDIYSSLLQGYIGGCFKVKYIRGPRLMMVNSYLSKFNMGWSGGGDQSLFLFADTFNEIQGFNEDLQIMEDFDLVDRLQKIGDFDIIPNEIEVSTRKFRDNSYFKVQLANILVFQMYRLGYSQEMLKNTYSRMVDRLR